MTDKDTDQRRNMLLSALNQKKVININEKILLQKCTKKEADSIILKIYDDMLFEYNQILQSSIALEKCCKELAADKNIDEDAFMAMYIEHLFENVIDKPEPNKDEPEKPVFKVINGGLSEVG